MHGGRLKIREMALDLADLACLKRLANKFPTVGQQVVAFSKMSISAKGVTTEMGDSAYPNNNSHAADLLIPQSTCVTNDLPSLSPSI